MYISSYVYVQYSPLTHAPQPHVHACTNTYTQKHTPYICDFSDDQGAYTPIARSRLLSLLCIFAYIYI